MGPELRKETNYSWSVTGLVPWAGESGIFVGSSGLPLTSQSHSPRKDVTCKVTALLKSI
jgi:hypothetical protein